MSTQKVRVQYRARRSIQIGADLALKELVRGRDVFLSSVKGGEYGRALVVVGGGGRRLEY